MNQNPVADTPGINAHSQFTDPNLGPGTLATLTFDAQFKTIIGGNGGYVANGANEAPVDGIPIVLSTARWHVNGTAAVVPRFEGPEPRPSVLPGSVAMKPLRIRLRVSWLMAAVALVAVGLAAWRATRPRPNLERAIITTEYGPDGRINFWTAPIYNLDFSERREAYRAEIGRLEARKQAYLIAMPYHINIHSHLCDYEILEVGGAPRPGEFPAYFRFPGRR